MEKSLYLLLAALLLVGGVVVYGACDIWSVKGWKGVGLVVLSVIGISVVCYILLLLAGSLFGPSFD
jgi:hypothetical protein